MAAVPLLIVVSVSAVIAHHTATSQNQPTVGQDGKDVEWVPTPPELVDTILTLASVNADDVVIDLGSGDGRTVIAAALRGARAIGVEYDADLVAMSQTRATDAGVSHRASFIEADLFDVDLSSATVITMFLLPDLNLKLRPTLLELNPGTRIVSNTWDMGDWIADETVQLDPCPGFCTALLWRVPADVTGTWKTNSGELVAKQMFQMVSGTIRYGESNAEITDGRLLGRELTFNAGTSHYQGRIDGNRIYGTVANNGQRVEWVATRTTR